MLNNYKKQLKTLGREAVRIQKAADRVYARGCAEVVNTLKDSLVGRYTLVRNNIDKKKEK